MSPRPFWCRLGLHRRVWLDSAGAVAAQRCGACNDWIDRELGAEVDDFRAWCDANPDEVRGKVFGIYAIYRSQK